MDRKFQSHHFTSQKVKDRIEGYEGYELLLHKDGKSIRLAWLVYWDAAPGYFFETFHAPFTVSLDILEEFIAETLTNMNASRTT